MRIMLKACYKRADTYGGKAQLIGAEYGEVPDALIMGEMALAGRDCAIAHGDLRAAEIISRAVEAAKKDGVLMTLDE